jgi:hypothetical protein
MQALMHHSVHEIPFVARRTTQHEDRGKMPHLKGGLQTGCRKDLAVTDQTCVRRTLYLRSFSRHEAFGRQMAKALNRPPIIATSCINGDAKPARLRQRCVSDTCQTAVAGQPDTRGTLTLLTHQLHGERGDVGRDDTCLGGKNVAVVDYP